MGLWDAFCDHILIPAGELIGDTAVGVGRAVDAAVNTVIIDGIGGTLDKVVDTVKENPVESAAVAVVTVATGGAAWAFAGPIAATIGGAGLLGSASTGTAISTLSGAALTNASLAALGGGALAAGGGGMAAGTVVVAGTGAVAGAAASGAAVTLTNKAA